MNYTKIKLVEPGKASNKIIDLRPKRINRRTINVDISK